MELEVQPFGPEVHEGPASGHNWSGLPQVLVDFDGEVEVGQFVAVAVHRSP